ncbi:MAG: hypothetical protein IH900_00520 [Proteobacteria bacterium]|nr:hypothetical protein [Pseudomonadota bacterium]
MEEETLRRCIARMVAAKESMNTARDELIDIRREARSDGANIQALNPLVDILGEHGHVLGARVLADLFHYAQVAGSDLRLAGNRMPDDVNPQEIPQHRRAAATNLKASRSETLADAKAADEATEG